MPEWVQPIFARDSDEVLQIGSLILHAVSEVIEPLKLCWLNAMQRKFYRRDAMFYVPIEKYGVAEKQDDLERSFKSFSIIFIPLLSNAKYRCD
ncbi:MAG: hypothetical protein KME16_02845 [Scytolyngbya sp. HA4215-MV1]|nr:hypothetical protein [Scytolyngbya sp. HA4215-MV1]